MIAGSVYTKQGGPARLAAEKGAQRCTAGHTHIPAATPAELASESGAQGGCTSAWSCMRRTAVSAATPSSVCVATARRPRSAELEPCNSASCSPSTAASTERRRRSRCAACRLASLLRTAPAEMRTRNSPKNPTAGRLCGRLCCRCAAYQATFLLQMLQQL